MPRISGHQRSPEPLTHKQLRHQGPFRAGLMVVLTQGPPQDGTTINPTAEGTPCPGWARGRKEAPWACVLCVSRWKWEVLNSLPRHRLRGQNQASLSGRSQEAASVFIAHLRKGFWQQTCHWRITRLEFWLELLTPGTLHRPLHKLGSFAKLHRGSR